MPYIHSHHLPQCDLRQWPAFFVWKKHVEGVLRQLTDNTPAIPVVPLPSHTDVPVPNAYMIAAAPAIPQEVQTLLLSETATVTDLSMSDDPLAFDSDESAIFGHIANTFASPIRESPERQAPIHVAAHLTPAALPTVCHVARNSTTTIHQLKAQVPHDTQRATEQAIKQHKEKVSRTHNAKVKKRRAELGMDLGASVIIRDVGETADVVHTPNIVEQPIKSTKRRRKSPVVPVMPTPSPVPKPRIPGLDEVCAHGSTLSDLRQLDHVRHHMKPGQYLYGKHCTKCQTPVATVLAKKLLVFYCTQDFRAFTLGPAAALSPCHCLVCPRCHANAPEEVGTGRRRRRT
jgi:hypothetical protein